MHHNMAMDAGEITVAGLDVPYEHTAARQFELEADDILPVPIWEVYDAFRKLSGIVTLSVGVNIFVNISDEDISFATDSAEDDHRVLLEALCHDGRVSSREEFLELLEAALWNIRATRAGVPWYNEASYGLPSNFGFRFRVPGDVPVGLIVEALQSLLESTYYPPSAASSPASVLRMIRSGRPDALLGKAECEWLDNKSFPYERTSKGHVELAKDVASFANSELGGILVIGFSTEIIDGKEVICALAPIRPDPSLPDAYRKTVDARIYPPVVGFEVCYLNVDHGAMIAIVVPPQPEGNKLYLVQGGIIDGGKYDGNTISIVERRGDGTLHTGVAAIHADLSAARLARRRENLDRRDKAD